MTSCNYKSFLRAELQRLENKLQKETDQLKKHWIMSEIARVKHRIGKDVKMSAYGVDC
jgi:hypothetical protein